jgi:two-component system nitrate/nitrite response regulator NarL
MTGAGFRVTVVDDHSLLAESLVIALRSEDVEASCVIVTATSEHQALAKEILSGSPTLVVLDLDLGAAGDGMSFVSELRKAGVGVMVLTGSTNRLRIGEALSLGASTVLSKSAPFGDILHTIQRMRIGLPVTSTEERTALISVWREAKRSELDIRRRFEQITRREAEVLGELMAGNQVSEIAKQRFVSESTVRTQVKSVLAKLQVNSQLTAVGLAHQIGWRPPAAETRGRSSRPQQRGTRRPTDGQRRPQPSWAAAG